MALFILLYLFAYLFNIIFYALEENLYYIFHSSIWNGVNKKFLVIAVITV